MYRGFYFIVTHAQVSNEESTPPTLQDQNEHALSLHTTHHKDPPNCVKIMNLELCVLHSKHTVHSHFHACLFIVRSLSTTCALPYSTHIGF